MENQIIGLSGDAELGQFVDAATGAYVYPIIANSATDLLQSLVAAREADGDLAPNEPKPKLRVCVLDSGILTEHPLFKGRIVGERDFTGEGIEDAHGHGSMVSYLFLHNYGKQFELEFIVGKVLRSNKSGEERWLIDALEWAGQQQADIINLSAGIDRTVFGINLCFGTCRLCRSAKRAAEKVKVMLVAAGNHGNTTCPARSGVKDAKSKVKAVGARDERTGQPEKWSGKGTVYLPNTYRIASLKVGASDQERLAFLTQAASRLLESRKRKDAAEVLELVCTLVKRMGADGTEAYQLRYIDLLGDLASDLKSQGQRKEAVDYYQQLIDFAKLNNVNHRLDEKLFTAHLFSSRALRELKQYQKAYAHWWEARQILTRIGDSIKDGRLFYYYEVAGFLELMRGENAVAVAYFEHAYKQPADYILRSTYDWCAMLLNRAAAKMGLGDDLSTLQAIKEGKSMAEHHVHPKLLKFADDLLSKHSSYE